ncbi:PhnB protein [Tenacibaculum sp. 190524A05c]|uniref:VOC family protein n=1 Tax=Tenacibaculum platacis TaxID=3137852 RepID=UPI0031FB4A24
MKRIITVVLFSLIISSCSDSKKNTSQLEKIKSLETKIDSLNQLVESSKSTKGQIATFLTFQKDNAEQAMNFYMDLFDNSKIINLKRWKKGSPGKEGKIMHATFKLNDRLFMCSDSPAIHAWSFTPAVSNFIECKDENQIKELFTKLSENGKVMMPLGNYGFSQKFAFVEDQFGVSWQLNLE